jgi:cell filamentation protein
MTDDFYIYPGTTILRNKLGIIDADELDAFERRMVAGRAAEGVPTGGFDLAHLQAIHRHLFQDVYDWAGNFAPSKFPKAGINSFFASTSKTACLMFTAA